MNAIDTSTKRMIRTRIFTYNLNVNDDKQAKEYAELCARMKAQGVKCFDTWGAGKGHYAFVQDLELSGKEIDLETEHLFDNQWNTGPVDGSEQGLRVFEWAQDYPINFPEHYKRGHYLEITPEMRAFQKDWHACGYCGKQYHKTNVPAFCTACIDGPHLEAKELYLLRPLPIAGGYKKRAPLTEQETAELMPRYVEAQTKGTTERGIERIKKQRADIISKAEREIKNATDERDGFLWLMDHGIKIDNVIFYNHTRRFSFGWRQPVGPEIEKAILEHMSEFPFLYEIKCQDGRTLSNEE